VQGESEVRPPEIGAFETAAVWLVIAVTLLNAASVLFECGFAWCPADPVRYELIEGLRAP
jgi:hypothetical protein